MSMAECACVYVCVCVCVCACTCMGVCGYTCELYLSSLLGAALIAFEMFSELSRQAVGLSETELSEELEGTAE